MRRKDREKGQVMILALLALGLFIFGALGLAIDGANLYLQRQMAQAAADAAAQAAMMSIFNHTNTAGPAQFPTTDFTCSTTSTATPCVYARNNGFGATARDTVRVEFPGSVPGVTGLSDDPVNLVRVTITRDVDTTLMRLIGADKGTIRVEAVAAILQTTSPTPILVLHPTIANALQIDGGGIIEICGGPPRAVQVNSRHPNAYAPPASGMVDLRKAGPDGPTYCDADVADAGADFGTFGGPAPPTPIPDPVFRVYTGPDGTYRQPSSPIEDPYKNVMPPDQPSTPGTKETFPQGIHPGCPVGNVKPCTLYKPGYYANGIEVKNEVAFFAPGIYYMGNGKGFVTAANGDVYMCPTSHCSADSTTGWVQNMLVYNAGGGTFDVGSNGNVNLIGSPQESPYLGLLFFEDRAAPPNNATAGAGSKPHRLGGGGCIDLTGGIYLTNTLDRMLANVNHYQQLTYAGNPCSGTWITGDIVVDRLYLTGTSDLRMRLDRNRLRYIRQVALVK